MIFRGFEMILLRFVKSKFFSLFRGVGIFLAIAFAISINKFSIRVNYIKISENLYLNKNYSVI